MIKIKIVPKFSITTNTQFFIANTKTFAKVIHLCDICKKMPHFLQKRHFYCQKWRFLGKIHNFLLPQSKFLFILFVYVKKMYYLCARFSTIVSGDQHRARFFAARTVAYTIAH